MTPSGASEMFLRTAHSSRPNLRKTFSSAPERLTDHQENRGTKGEASCQTNQSSSSSCIRVQSTKSAEKRRACPTYPYHGWGGVATDKLKVSKQYLELALNRLEKGHEFTFYRGKPFSSASGKPYSFTPAKLFAKNDARCGERFALDIDAVNRCLPTSSRKLSPGLTQHFKKIDVQPETIVSIWNEIARQVRKSDFVPGVQFNWPK